MVEPNTMHGVPVEFALCFSTYDQEQPNYFMVIADARPERTAGTGLSFPFYRPDPAQDDSSASLVPGSAMVWRHKRFEFETRSNAKARST
jgi:hypothetical protein